MSTPAVLALATVGLAVAMGLGLSCFYLLERPVLGWARRAAFGHGALGVVGAAVVAALVWRASGPAGLGPLTAGLLGGAVLGGGVIGLAHLRRRRAPGLAVVLHATLGLAGFVLLVAYVSVPR